MNLENFNIDFRNPIEFVNQWQYSPLSKKIRAIFIWLFYCWRRNDCDVWIKYGIRIIGIEIGYTQWLI